MKTKTIKIMLATVVTAIAVNAFVIVSNSNVGIDLIKGNVEALTDPGSGGNGGPRGDGVAHDYNCYAKMHVVVTVTNGHNGSHTAHLDVSGGTTMHKVVNINAEAGYSYQGTNSDETVTLVDTEIIDDNTYPGRICDEQHDYVCDNYWHPCAFYHAQYVYGLISNNPDINIDFPAPQMTEYGGN